MCGLAVTPCQLDLVRRAYTVGGVDVCIQGNWQEGGKILVDHPMRAKLAQEAEGVYSFAELDEWVSFLWQDLAQDALDLM